MTLKRALLSGALTAFLAMASATAALAGTNGAGTTTVTQHHRNVVIFSNATKNPCNGDPGTITALAKTEVMHQTQQADGTFWFTQTAQGMVTFTPTDSSQPSGMGHFTLWFGESSNNQNRVKHSTATFVLKTSDGHHVVVKMRDHLSTNANGVITSAFKTKSVTCR